MKMISLTLLIFLTTTLLADKNWIQLEPLNKAQKAPLNIKHNINLSQIPSINNIMQKATILKQLVDATNTKKTVPTNNKNWIALNKANQ